MLHIFVGICYTQQPMDGWLLSHEFCGLLVPTLIHDRHDLTTPVFYDMDFIKICFGLCQGYHHFSLRSRPRKVEIKLAHGQTKNYHWLILQSKCCIGQIVTVLCLPGQIILSWAIRSLSKCLHCAKVWQHHGIARDYCIVGLIHIAIKEQSELSIHIYFYF